MILNIALWELFKRLVKPNTLTKLINKHGEEGLKRLLADKVEDDFGNNTWFGGYDSSNINQIRYDSETSVMGVMFNNGSVYDYYDVPRSVAYEFVTYPGSKGKWFWDNIRGGKADMSNYAYSRVGVGISSRVNRVKESGYSSTHVKRKR